MLLVIAATGSVVAAAGSWLQERRNSRAQMAAVHRKLGLVMGYLGVAPPEEPKVTRHVENGQIIETVHAYRKLTGATCSKRSKRSTESPPDAVKPSGDHVTSRMGRHTLRRDLSRNGTPARGEYDDRDGH